MVKRYYFEVFLGGNTSVINSLCNFRSTKAEICEDFKTVYRADDQVEGQAELDKFCSKWNNSYPKVTKSSASNNLLLIFIISQDRFGVTFT